MCGCSKDVDKLNFRFFTLLLTYPYLFITNIFMYANARSYLYLKWLSNSFKTIPNDMLYFDILQYDCSLYNEIRTYDTRYCLALINPISFLGRGQTQGSTKLAPFHTVRFVDHHHLDIVWQKKLVG